MKLCGWWCVQVENAHQTSKLCNNQSFFGRVGFRRCLSIFTFDFSDDRTCYFSRIKVKIKDERKKSRHFCDCDCLNICVCVYVCGYERVNMRVWIIFAVILNMLKISHFHWPFRNERNFRTSKYSVQRPRNCVCLITASSTYLFFVVVFLARNAPLYSNKFDLHKFSSFFLLLSRWCLVWAKAHHMIKTFLLFLHFLAHNVKEQFLLKAGVLQFAQYSSLFV